MNYRDIISHIRVDDKCIQTNEEHSRGVAELAEYFTRDIGWSGWGNYLGLLHDKGKEKKDFQTYIRLMNNLPVKCNFYKDKTHAYVGALLAKKYFPQGYPFVAYALSGHHAGMPDFVHLETILSKAMPEDICEDNIPASPIPSNMLSHMESADVNHLFRMLYSCLVDADYLDTESFVKPSQSCLRGNITPLSDLLPLLERYLNNIADKSIDSPINLIRKKVQDKCRQTAESPTGVYSLTVPTGGGKTLSSLLWAMIHAIKNGKKRIIISIPYTSIITQTAKLLKDIFGEENVLEHHSNIQFGENYDDVNSITQKLATENWAFPIIVTTNVQLLESMYSSHPSKCRKLHNIANSVVLFDEVQTFPGERLQPIVDALKTYNRFFGVSLLFTTASQPTLEGRCQGHRNELKGFEKIEEIIPASWKLHEKLKRVNLRFREEPIDYDEIAAEIMSHYRVLCVVNTRKDAGEIFSRLIKYENCSKVFHLSRMMCSEHLDRTIKEIKAALKDDKSTPVRVVSTQLVEAGVDIDFPVVMRQEAGLDSILQAAGRCNREGRLKELGITEVFSIKGRKVPSGTLNYANQARKNMSEQKEWFSPDVISEYFKQFYCQIPTFDKKVDIEGTDWTMKELLYNPRELMFDTADKAFHLIDSNGISVVINYDECSNLIEQLKRGEVNKALFRKLNRFSVNLTDCDFKSLHSSGMIENINGIYYLSDSNQYDTTAGLKINNHWIDETLIL